MARASKTSKPRTAQRAKKTSTKTRTPRADSPLPKQARTGKATKAAKPSATKARSAARPATKKLAAKAPSARTRRADFGAPIDAFFARQPAPLRTIVDSLRALIEAAAPDASASIKWGMPMYEIGGKVMCAVGAHKSHVNLILSGPPGSFDDPGGLLAGAGKTGRHLKLTRLDQLPRAQVQAWLRKAAQLARG